jgi:glucokinase
MHLPNDQIKSALCYYIGIDIGGSHAAFGLVDSLGMIVDEFNLCTPEFNTAEDFVAKSIEEIKKLLSKNNISRISGVGIGAPNGNFFSGCIENAPNLPWKGIVPLAKMIEEKLNLCPVRLTNDANAAALGELKYGIAARKNIRDFIMITLGTGLGSGVVVDGKLVYGHDGFAGELGHSLVDINGGRNCACGRQGCLERYVSATGIVITANEMSSVFMKDSLLKNKEKISSFDISEAALSGDLLALEIFDFTAQKLAFTLANVTTVTRPEAFIFFGGLANAGELLLKPLRQYFEQYVAVLYRGKVKMLLSEIPENQAAILGASALVNL